MLSLKLQISLSKENINLSRVTLIVSGKTAPLIAKRFTLRDTLRELLPSEMLEVENLFTSDQLVLIHFQIEQSFSPISYFQLLFNGSSLSH